MPPVDLAPVTRSTRSCWQTPHRPPVPPATPTPRHQQHASQTRLAGRTRAYLNPASSSSTDTCLPASPSTGGRSFLSVRDQRLLSASGWCGNVFLDAGGSDARPLPRPPGPRRATGETDPSQPGGCTWVRSSWAMNDHYAKIVHEARTGEWRREAQWSAAARGSSPSGSRHAVTAIYGWVRSHVARLGRLGAVAAPDGAPDGNHRRSADPASRSGAGAR